MKYYSMLHGGPGAGIITLEGHDAPRDLYVGIESDLFLGEHKVVAYRYVLFGKPEKMGPRMYSASYTYHGPIEKATSLVNEWVKGQHQEELDG